MYVSMVAADLTKRVAWGPAIIKRIYGWNAQAADLFIQFHQKLDVATNDVPAVKSVWAPGSGAAFGWPFTEDLSLTECTIAISTDETKYVPVAAASGLDLTCVLDTDHFFDSAVHSIVGDLTTGVASKQIWSEASQAPTWKNRLLRLDLVNNDTVDVAFVTQATDTANVNDKSSLVKVLANGGTFTQMFGKGGLVPRHFQAPTERKGCTVRVADLTAGFVGSTLTFKAGTDYAIRALVQADA